MHRGTGVLSPKEEFFCRSSMGKGGRREVANTEGLRNGHCHQLYGVWQQRAAVTLEKLSIKAGGAGPWDLRGQAESWD